MKKRYKILGTALVMSAFMSIPAFAGNWMQDSTKPSNQNGITNWWYRNDDGSYPRNTWIWLDGNKDGISESYRFDANGWMYANTKIDGYDVNGSGAWTVNGIVQTKNSQNGKASETSKKNQQVQDSDENEQKTETNGTIQQLSEEGLYEDWAMECFDLINAERKKNGVSALKHDEDIQEACNIRAQELAESYSHTRPDGTSCFTVFDEVGIDYSSAGENICAGYSSAAAAVNGWMNSSGHRANILDKKFKKSALGFYYAPNSSWGYYWVEMFTN